MTKSMTEVVAAIVSELTPLGSDERRRIIQASLLLLGEELVGPAKHSAPHEQENDDGTDLPARAKSWMKQNGLAVEQLHQLFHIMADDVEVIASEIPGKANRDKVRNAYLLSGVVGLLVTGDAKFGDKEARLLCERFGFFDTTNHAKYLKGGNELAGSKDKGWSLTAPGLKQAAMLISELSRAT